jgi:ribonuclease G
MSFELLLGRYAGQSWAAVFESGRVVEVYIELLRGETEVGKIIKARVSRVLPGIQAAFIDLGGEQDGFLPVRDLMAAGESVAHWEQGGANSHPRDVAPIEDRIRVGSELLVQVARDALGTKGARLTCNLSIAGRLLVLFPRLHARKVSRKIDDPEERERLLGIAQRLPDEQLGFVVRTAARGASERAIRADAEDLRDTWHEIDARIKQAASPSVVYEAHNLVFRMLRDAPREVLGRIIVEDVEDRDSVLRMLDRIDPDLSSHVEMHTGRESLFETYNIETEIGKALRAKVWLKSGGYLIIEPTEALVSIDVNTGKFVGRKHLEETVLKTNLEAAREVTRQLRLRSLGGVIVIDFIDMESEASRREVIEAIGYLFDESFPLLFNDVDLYHRIKDQGITSHVVPSIRVVHLGGVSSQKIDAARYRSLQDRGMFGYFKKHHPMQYGLLVLAWPARWLRTLGRNNAVATW